MERPEEVGWCGKSFVTGSASWTLGRCVSAVAGGVLETLTGPHTLNRVALLLACVQTVRRGLRGCQSSQRRWCWGPESGRKWFVKKRPRSAHSEWAVTQISECLWFSFVSLKRIGCLGGENGNEASGLKASLWDQKLSCA